jgi:ssRNA-specific RNase YbeY (16S rRNA maturation enzyme)
MIAPSGLEEAVSRLSPAYVSTVLGDIHICLYKVEKQRLEIRKLTATEKRKIRGRSELIES